MPRFITNRHAASLGPFSIVPFGWSASRPPLSLISRYQRVRVFSCVALSGDQSSGAGSHLEGWAWRIGGSVLRTPRQRSLSPSGADPQALRAPRSSAFSVL